jgi:hypothetical protein
VAVTMTFEQFMEEVQFKHDMNNYLGEDLRLGQIFFNELCVVRPAIAEEIRGSMLDPFFKHRITQVVSDFVRERW